MGKRYVREHRNRWCSKIADIVLQEAIDNDYGIPKDDMTVLVAKIEKI